MTSSTSPSDSSVPALAIRLLVVALLAWAGGANYSLRLNPEVAYYQRAAAVKAARAEKLTREHPAKYVIYGGSSCEFSIDAGRLLERDGLPAVNLGRGAGMGASVLTQGALEHVRPGDTLLVTLEPGLLSGRLEPTSLGTQFSFAIGHPEWIVRPSLPAPASSWFTAAVDLRPGGYHVFTLLGKLAAGKPLYRYRFEGLQPSGWYRTTVQLAAGGKYADFSLALTTEARAFLRALRAWSDHRGVRVAYSLPWAYVPPEHVSACQKINGLFLLEVLEFLPALKDPRLGVYSVSSHFADTTNHLNDQGTPVRTDELADQLKFWKLWTPEELRAQLAGL